MIKKLFGFFVFVCLGLSFCYSWEYVPCQYGVIQGDFATSGDCIKALPNEIVDISNYKFTIKGSNITVYDYSTNDTYSGLYGKNRYNGLNVTRNIYKEGKFVTLYKVGRGLSEPRYSMLSGSIACISDDYNSCMYNTSSFRSIYYERDLSVYNGLSYDYVILPYTQQSTNAQSWGYCFHFPTLSGYLCFPIFQNSSLNGYTYTGITSDTFENTVSDTFPFGGHGSNQIYYNQYQCPTVKQIIDNYNANGFYTGMCYTLDKIFNGSTFETIEPQSILDLYSSSESFVNDLYKFGQYCESSVYNQSVCQEAFSGQVYKFNLLAKLPTNLTYLGGRKQTYIYCNLYTLPLNATTCTLGTGILGSLGIEFTNSDVVHSLANGEYAIVHPNTSGTVYDGDYVWSGDIISNVQDMFTRFTSLFKKQTGNSNGFLPTWIIYPFLILVLFKLFKK